MKKARKNLIFKNHFKPLVHLALRHCRGNFGCRFISTIRTLDTFCKDSVLNTDPISGYADGVFCLFI